MSGVASTGDWCGKKTPIAGHGKAGSTGWQWIEDNALAGQVQQAIEIYRKERSPDYVKLPF